MDIYYSWKWVNDSRWLHNHRYHNSSSHERDFQLLWTNNMRHIHTRLVVNVKWYLWMICEKYVGWRIKHIKLDILKWRRMIFLPNLLCVYFSSPNSSTLSSWQTTTKLGESCIIQFETWKTSENYIDKLFLFMLIVFFSFCHLSLQISCHTLCEDVGRIDLCGNLTTVEWCNGMSFGNTRRNY